MGTFTGGGFVEMLGHSQTAFTMDRYQHVSLAMRREAASAIELALS
jgi:hypothetical protein